MAAGGIYQVLIENPTPGASYRLLSGNGDVVGLEAMQENYISRSGKSGVLCTVRGRKPGTAWVEIRGSDGKMASFSVSVS